MDVITDRVNSMIAFKF